MSTFVISEEEHDALKHYGIKRKSGRYPWGSGDDNVARSRDFLNMVNDLRRQGLSDTEIAKHFSDPDDPKNPFTTTMLRATNTIARAEKRAADISQAQRLKDHGLSNGAIAEKMGLPGESSVRALLDPGAKVRGEELQNIAGYIKGQVDQKGIIDVGVGNEHHLDINETQFKTAMAMLESEGYNLHKIQVDQLGTGQKTTVRVMLPPGKQYEGKEGYIYAKTHADDIQLLKGSVAEGGQRIGIQKPLSIDQSRVGIVYKEQGGADADGVMYVRRGVKDVELGGSNYAQVRVAVDGTHYIKGMAIYKDDLPPGVDIQFNTNKKDTGNKLDALKPMKTMGQDDPRINDEDPFGSAIDRQITKLLPDGSKKVTSAMNIVNEEGAWGDWSRNLATQMLSKQQPSLAKEQLAKTLSRKREEYDEINALTNPAVKKRLLESFYDDLDSSAVHLRAAAMPGQATQVILPIGRKDIKPTEIYAPQFKHGDRVVLVRYPHGGKFEMPELVVNNNNKAGKSLIGSMAKDAVGIHPDVAERLSGADFDGDTVLVIPNNSGKVKTSPALDALKGFDVKASYPAYDGMKTVDGGYFNAATGKVDYRGKSPGSRKQTEMGVISNLITDMTIKGASNDELARAVKHSMVVIDSEKHVLNYKQSEKDNNIKQLKEKYQKKTDSDGYGASTLISRTSRQASVLDRKQTYKIDPATGEKIWTYTGAGYQPKDKVLKDGTIVPQPFVYKKIRSTEGAEAKDAHTLSSGTPIERIYADHSNALKALANTARKEHEAVRTIPYDKRAKALYDSEVRDLNAQLKEALRNAPLERQAQLVANAKVKMIKDANPGMDRDDIKKANGKALQEARLRVGAGKTLVKISDRQWEAIQAGAISNDKLETILKNTDLDRIKELATPRANPVMTDGKVASARALLNAGRTPSEVAAILGVSPSTLSSSLNPKEK